MSRRSECRCAFTLVEVMLAIVLIALTASLGAVGLTNADRSARIDRTVASALDADAHGRLAARGEHGVLLNHTQTATSHELVLQRGEDRMLELEIPHGIELTWIDPESGVRLSYLEFDRIGQSRDYLLRVSGGAHTQFWRISGQTGWAQEIEEDLAP